MARHSDDPWTPWGPPVIEVAPVLTAPVPLSACARTHGKHCSLRRRWCPRGNPAERRTYRNTRHRTSKTPTGSDTFHAGGTTVSRTGAPVHRSRTADTMAECSTPLSFSRVSRHARTNALPVFTTDENSSTRARCCPFLSRRTPLQIRWFASTTCSPSLTLRRSPSANQLARLTRQLRTASDV